VRKVLPHAHVEACRGTEAENEAYVEKIPTTAGPVESFGAFVIPAPGVSKGMLALEERVKAGASMEELAEHHFAELVRHHKGVQFVHAICNPKRAHISFHLDEFLWEPENGWGGGVGAVIFHGESGIGKTEFALAHFDNPLHVCGSWDQIRNFQPKFHDGIIFDDFDDELQQKTGQAGQWFTEWDHEQEARVLYDTTTIPRWTKKIFVTNEPGGVIFKKTPGLARRVKYRLLLQPGFAEKKDPCAGKRALDEADEGPNAPNASDDGQDDAKHDGDLSDESEFGEDDIRHLQRSPSTTQPKNTEKRSRDSHASTEDQGPKQRRRMTGPVVLDPDEEPGLLVRANAQPIMVNPEWRARSPTPDDADDKEEVPDVPEATAPLAVDELDSELHLTGSQHDDMVAAVLEVEKEVNEEDEDEAARDSAAMLAVGPTGQYMPTSTPPWSTEDKGDAVDENDPSMTPLVGEMGLWNADDDDTATDEAAEDAVTGELHARDFIDDEADAPVDEEEEVDEEPNSEDLRFLDDDSDALSSLSDDDWVDVDRE